MRVHRQPGERDRRARGESRDGLLRVRSRRPGAGEDPVDRGVRRQGRARQRQLRRREPPLLRGRGGAAVGVRQREHAPVLRGGFEVARVRDRGAARVASPGSRRGADRVRGAADQDPSRVQRADRDRSRRREAVPGVRRAGRGLLAGRAGVRGRRRRRHAGEARHDRTVARDRRARRRVLRPPGGSDHRRRDRGMHRGRDRRWDPPARRDRGRVHGNGRRGHDRGPEALGGTRRRSRPTKRPSPTSPGTATRRSTPSRAGSSPASTSSPISTGSSRHWAAEARPVAAIRTGLASLRSSVPSVRRC